MCRMAHGVDYCGLNQCSQKRWSVVCKASAILQIFLQLNGDGLGPFVQAFATQRVEAVKPICDREEVVL